MITVNIHEVKITLSELLRKVEQGEIVVICWVGELIVQLVRAASCADPLALHPVFSWVIFSGSDAELVVSIFDEGDGLGFAVEE